MVKLLSAPEGAKGQGGRREVDLNVVMGHAAGLAPRLCAVNLRAGSHIHNIKGPRYHKHLLVVSPAILYVFRCYLGALTQGYAVPIPQLIQPSP